MSKQNYELLCQEVEKVRVVHGADFRNRWNGLYITEDQFNYCVETSDSDDIKQQLIFHEFENHSFKFNQDAHEEMQ